MVSIKVICAACLKDVRECRCPDEPVEEHYGFFWNRAGEELLRWLRFCNIIK